MVSSGVVMQEAVAPAITPPAAWTATIVGWLGGASWNSFPWPKSLFYKIRQMYQNLKNKSKQNDNMELHWESYNETSFPDKK